jgi:hypothetical protein
LVHTTTCRHVPLLYNSSRESLSLTDEEALRACVRWRAIGIEVLHMTNVSGTIPETFLVGPEDFAYDVVAHPRRFYRVMQKPWIFVRAILHMQYMTPVRVAVRNLHRWWVHSHIEAFSRV